MPTRRPARPRLSPDAIVTAAVTMADRGGPTALSMRRLAGELGVTAMSLYWHFDDRDQLVDAMAEHVVTEADFSDDPAAPWPDRLRTVLTTLVELLRRHPWMGRPVVERLVPLPHYLSALEIMLDCTRAAGLDLTSGAILAQQVAQSAVALVENGPEQQRGDGAANADHRDLLTAMLGEDERFENVRAALIPLTTPPDPDMYYHLGILAIVGGVEAVAAGTTPQSAPSRRRKH